VRRNIAEAFSVISSQQISEDMVVPPASIAELVRQMEDMGKRYGLPVPSYGHAGDGNLHTRIIKNPEWSMERWKAESPKIQKELYEMTAALGGMLSGEHGIGHKRKKFMPMFVSEEYLRIISSIKRAMDPNNVLNPGKIVDA